MIPGLLGKLLYQKRWFILGWIFGFAIMSVLMLVMYPAFKDTQLDKVLEGLSPALQKVAGGNDSLATVDKYIQGQVFALRMPLLSIIMTIILFVGLFVGDEKRGLLLTQMSLPLSRSRILFTKLLAALIVIVVTALGMFGGLLIGGALIGESVDLGMIAQHAAGSMLIGLDFGAIVLLVGGGFGLRGLATGLAAMLAFLSYLISSMVAMVEYLEPVEKLSLFHYYQNPTPISLGNAGILLGFAAFCVIVGWLAFRGRDIS